MADIISDAQRRPASSSPVKIAGASQDFPDISQDLLYNFAEALFFAYRDFTREPDRILNEIRFGRAHHRVLHFVHRYPGMRVARLLDILQITKQSLARVLRELVREGYILQKAGEADKRERLLYTTESGALLAERLAALQFKRIKEALEAVKPDEREAVERFLNNMVSDSGQLPYKRAQMQERAADEERKGG